MYTYGCIERHNVINLRLFMFDIIKVLVGKKIFIGRRVFKGALLHYFQRHCLLLMTFKVLLKFEDFRPFKHLMELF